MNRSSLVVAAAVVAATTAACAHQRASVSYSAYQTEVPVRVEGWDGRRLGMVRAHAGGAVWKDCSDVARGALFVLIEETRKVGGNAIGEIRWFPDLPRRTTSDPSCRQRYGLVLMWPLLATPLFQSAAVEAYAYRVDPDELADGLLLIPEESEDDRRLVEQMLPTIGATARSRSGSRARTAPSRSTPARDGRCTE